MLPISNYSFNFTDYEPGFGGIPEEARMAVNFFYGLLFTLGVPGNLIIITAILSSSDLRTTSTSIFIFNLAIADSMFLTWIPLIVYKSLIKEWPWGSVMCKLYFFISCVDQYVAVYFLILLCIDRYLAVCRPVKSRDLRHDYHKCFLAVMTGWISVSLLMSPLFVYASVQEEDAYDPINQTFTTRYQCGVYASLQDNNHTEGVYEQEQTRRRTFALTTFILGFLLPLLIMWSLYALLLHRLWTNRHMPSSGRQTRRLRATKLTLAILACYTICWTPLWTVNMLVEFGYNTVVVKLGHSFLYFAYLAHTFNFTNSALNPLLYTFLSSTYRSRVAQSFKCLKDPWIKLTGVSGTTGAQGSAYWKGRKEDHHSNCIPQTNSQLYEL